MSKTDRFAHTCQVLLAAQSMGPGPMFATWPTSDEGVVAMATLAHYVI